MTAKSFSISKETLHGIVLALVVLIVGILVIWGLGSMGDAMKTQLLGL